MDNSRNTYFKSVNGEPMCDLVYGKIMQTVNVD